MSKEKDLVDDQVKLNKGPIIENDGYFGIEKAELVTLFDKCGRNESFDEDIKEIVRLGGTEAILQKVRTSAVTGLKEGDENDLQRRILFYGENKFLIEEMPHCCAYVWEGLEDLMIRILIGAAIFQIVVGAIPQIQESDKDWIEGLSIIFAVVIVVSVGSITNFSKEKKFRELNDTNNALVKIAVKRDGHVKTIQEEEIYVGDIIKVELGMILPADGYLLEGNDIKVEEASLTGESDLIEKDSLDHVLKRIQQEIKDNKGVEPKGKHVVGSPLMFSGTEVAEGSGWYVALRIGPDSEKGKIQEQVRNEQNKAAAKKDEEGDKKKEEGGESPNKKLNIESQKEEKDDDGDDDDDDDDDGEDDDGKTPLEGKLDELANDIGTFGTISAGLTLGALAIRLIVVSLVEIDNFENGINYQYSNWFNTTILGEAPRVRESISGLKTLIEIIRMIILAIAIIVVAIPEGLPLAVTLSLAFSIGKMMEDNNLVRKMNACETMGGANYICSDKTGTLTKNEMSVERLFNCVEIKNFKELTANKENTVDPSTFFNSKYYETLRLALTLNIDVEIDSEEKIVKGSKTDYAFVHLLHNFKENIFTTRKQFEKGEEKKRFPFTSSRKKMSTIVSNEVFETGHLIYLKGASEIVLASCKYYLDPETNQQTLITDEKQQGFTHIIKDFANGALRTICIAFKNIDQDQLENWKEKDLEDPNINLIEKDEFCLIGIFGIKDQLREGVAEAVDKCQNAGIKVVMVTGDNIDTANAIARDCHIITKEIEEDAKLNNKIISYAGKEFYEKIGGMRCESCDLDLKFCTCPRSQIQADAVLKKKKEADPNFNEKIALRKEKIMNMDVFKEIYEDIRVIARSRPEDKFTMVFGLKKLGQVVAVTGDGTNDAPALSKSDVGFAMGISGTDIAKQAADIIILNDNFATIVQAVKWGRNIYDNIRKFIQFQLTVNICACLLVFIACCIGKETPLSAIQMLWVNLIMDSLGSLALATEPPTDNLLQRKPYPKNEYIINNLMWKHIFYQAMVELAILLFFYLYGHRIFPETDPTKIKLAQQLLDCYGTVPGQEGLLFQNVNYIIAGPVLYWPIGIEKLPDALPAKCGDFYEYKNLEEAHKYFVAIHGSVHLTVIFNTFVIYTLFNQINARVIDEHYNIFKDMHLNYLFILILFVELGLQALLVSVAGIGFKVAENGLDGPQWGICFAFGAITFLVSVILKPIPLQRCFEAIYNWSQSLKKKKGKEAKEGEDVEDKQENEGKGSVSSGAKINIELQSHSGKANNLIAEEVRINSKNSSQKNMIKADGRVDSKENNQRRESHSSHHEHSERKPNSVLLNLRRPSRQLTNKVLSGSKMRQIKEQ